MHSLNRFAFLKKCLHVAGFLQSGVLYANIRHDPRSEYNQQKSEHNKRQWSCGGGGGGGLGGWGCSGNPSGGFRGQSTLRKSLGSKKHIDWLKIDFNAAEIITVQDNN